MGVLADRRPHRLVGARFWHRRARVGQHRPFAAYRLDRVPVFECACGAVGLRSFDLAEAVLGALDAGAVAPEYVDDELVWFPRQTWEEAVDHAC